MYISFTLASNAYGFSRPVRWRDVSGSPTGANAGTKQAPAEVDERKDLGAKSRMGMQTLRSSNPDGTQPDWSGPPHVRFPLVAHRLACEARPQREKKTGKHLPSFDEVNALKEVDKPR